MREAEHGPSLPARPDAGVAPALEAEKPGDGAGVRIKRRGMAVRTIGTDQADLKDGIEVAVGESRPLRLPLGGPQHRGEIRARYR